VAGTTITVRTQPGSAFLVAAATDEHEFLVDEPVAVGGEALGPSPYELLLAALGSCTAMTVQMYARRKGWPLEGVRLRLAHDRVYRRDCADCDEPAARVDRITDEIELLGPLDDAQRARLIEIAGKCPVRKTLAAGIEVAPPVLAPSPLV
jgi:putative redox protein